jgi:manganese transport protein
MMAFAGPAYLISVGYMDPGNWATDLDGGARFGYRLLWVLVMSNAMAILLQTLSARLGIVTGRDLAQACRETYPRPVNLTLWFLCEIAIVACDLAEVLGAAIALNLLFHMPLLVGVAVTSFDTLLVLWFQKAGIRYLEAFILALIVIIAGCFTIEIVMAKPDYLGVAAGLIPVIDQKTLYIAIAMLGATVMPHNLYLHSALVQTRRIGRSPKQKQTACHYNLLDSVFALNGAMFVNAAINFYV